MAILPARHVEVKGATVLIRSATEADAPALIALDLEVVAAGVGTIYEPGEVNEDVEARRRKVRRLLDAPRSHLIVAEHGGRVIGEASFRAGHSRRTHHHGLLGLSVAAAWRNRGVGRALMTALIGWCRDHPDIERVCLWVFSNNEPALALYRSLGFVEEGRRVREIRLGPGKYCDDLVMALFVKAAPQRPGSGGAGVARGAD